MAHDTSQADTASTASSLEALFPRITAALCDAWNTPEIEQHLQALLIDNRSTRLGFPAEVIEELMSLDGVRAGRCKHKPRTAARALYRASMARIPAPRVT